jgi:C-terminal processing protease CtpA/Prc
LNDEAGYKDIAVLAVVSFEPNYAVEFQPVIQKLISDAKAAGKTKVIIDLSANGGDAILTGYDAFRQFFPQNTQDGFTLFREHDVFNIMAQ